MQFYEAINGTGMGNNGLKACLQRLAIDFQYWLESLASLWRKEEY